MSTELFAADTDGQLEMQPLHNTGRAPRSASTGKKQTWVHSRWTNLIAFILLCVGISLIFLKLDGVQTVMKNGLAPKSKEHQSVSALEARLTIGRQKLYALLQQDYGEYTDQVFDRDTIMSSFHPPSGNSSLRLRRRLKIKVLQALLAPPNATVDFVWATTGHSASAGHGNLFNQTYSASIEKAARTVFEELGINFYAKNYAMGGTWSAPEIAMCLPEIVGTDVDILSWDFGMTDGGNADKYALWSQRAGVMKTHPILFDFEGFEPHTDYNKYLDSNQSMAVFTTSLIGRKKLPSSDDPNVNVDSLPPGIKYYLCGGHPESGGDDCSSRRFDTLPVCRAYGNVRFQVNWHNGWKDHMFIGRSIAAFLVEYLSDAISELSDPPMDIDEPTPHLSQKYLNYLLQQESRDRYVFFTSPVPTNIADGKAIGSGNYSLFQRSNTVACHTARIPADARNRGLVLESHVSSTYLFAGKTTYNSTSEGYVFGKQPAPKQEEELQPYLTYDYRASCPYADIDAKDMFTIRDTDGWMKTVVPNHSEKNYYAIEKEMNQRHGFVMLCLKAFDWGNNPDYFAYIDKVGNETVARDVSVTINGINVTTVIRMNGCFLLSHAGGYMFPKSTNPVLDGQYEIRFRVNKPKGVLMISSIIVV